VGYYNRADGTFHLRNDATRPGKSDYAFTFGPVDPDQLQPVVGDWNNSGKDGIGYLQNGYEHLRNDAPRPGGSNFVLHYHGSLQPFFSGDWDGDGKAGIGFVQDVCGTGCEGGIDTQLYVREPAITATDSQFVFEAQSPNEFDQSIVVAGDWNGDGRDGLAVLNNDNYGPLRLYNDIHASGDTHHYSYQVGEAGSLPRVLVAGHWH
jgi:hypothetical protein